MHELFGKNYKLKRKYFTNIKEIMLMIIEPLETLIEFDE
jgi:hypothetical protein